MQSVPVLSLLGALLLSPLLTASCGGSATTGPSGSAGTAGSAQTAGAAGTAGSGTAGNGAAGAPMTDTCTTDADCTWGEFPKDLLKASDCPCVYGCGFIPQTIATHDRRAAQYDKLCNPQKDGMGNACGIDDCAQPMGLMCLNGSCLATRMATDN